MKKKTTDDLINEITSSNNINGYLDTNQDEFLNTSLHLHLQQLVAERQLQISQVVEKAFKGEYIYQIFRGIRRPGRDVLICIAIALELELKEAQLLLRTARVSQLEARDKRDAVIIFALSNNLSVPETNDLLYENEYACL